MIKRIRLTALTQGKDIPSTRFRWSQHVPTFSGNGFDVSTVHARLGAYPPANHAWRPSWGLGALAESTARVIRANVSSDLIFLQRNLLATLCTAERLLRRPFVFDVDDAIFEGPRGSSSFEISRRAAVTLCGNDFLAERFAPHGPVVIVPTAVDTDVFKPAPSTASRPTIGWSGSSSGFSYLYGIEHALKRVLEARPNAILKIVADRAPTFRKLPPERVQFVRWQPSNEASELHSFTVGIMPLEDSVWTRGKCSFKMLTYMASGLACVVSPIGMNETLLNESSVGIGARTDAEWEQSLIDVLDTPTLASRLGAAGRQSVEASYSRRVVGQALMKALHACL